MMLHTTLPRHKRAIYIYIYILSYRFAVRLRYGGKMQKLIPLFTFFLREQRWMVRHIYVSTWRLETVARIVSLRLNIMLTYSCRVAGSTLRGQNYKRRYDHRLLVRIRHLLSLLHGPSQATAVWSRTYSKRKQTNYCLIFVFFGIRKNTQSCMFL